MHCPYCGTDDGTARRLMPLDYTRVDCKWCGAEVVMEMTILKQPDVSKLTHREIEP